MKEYLTVRMPDNSLWAIPTRLIAENKAAYFAYQFDNDFDKSLQDVLSSFEVFSSEIWDWAQDNMNWSDFEGHRVLIENPCTDYDKAWAKGTVDIES